MSDNSRIQWLHKKIIENSYPNAMRLAERWGISHRQAQRDVDFLRRELEAPIAYSKTEKGFYYTCDYTLPTFITSTNDEDFVSVLSSISTEVTFGTDSSVIQMQIPYTAQIEVKDKLALLELKKFIISKSGKNKYVCEFNNVDMFLGALAISEADIKISEPDWIREKYIAIAKRILKNNK